MSESVVADFVAQAVHDTSDGPVPVRSRVLLSEDRLVVASEDSRTVVDLDDVVDVLVSQVPPELGDFLDQSVLVAWGDAARRRSILIAGDHEPIDRFARFLYKARLAGTVVRVRHPARTGGRIVDAPFRTATVVAQPTAVTFRNDDGAGEVRIGLEAVVDVARVDRTVDDATRSVLAVRYASDGRVLVTEVAHESPATLNVLGRFVRRECVGRDAALDGIDADDRTVAALVALYSGVDPDRLGRVLDRDDGEVRATLDELLDLELIGDPADPELTDLGLLAAVRSIDRVTD